MLDDSRITHIVNALKSWRLNGMAAALLESGGPLAFLGAQAVYFAEPLLSPFVPGDDLAALARVLEDPGAVQSLANRLAEDT